MLSKPLNGWSTVTIGTFNVKASDLVDIPIDWLKACIFGIRENSTIALFLDEEGSECYIASYYGVTYVIVDRDEVQIYSFDIDYRELAKEILEDIKTYSKEWEEWNPFCDSMGKERRRQLLYDLTDELGACLDGATFSKTRISK